MIFEEGEVEVWLGREILRDLPGPVPPLGDVGDGHQGRYHGLVRYERPLAPL